MMRFLFVFVILLGLVSCGEEKKKVNTFNKQLKEYSIHLTTRPNDTVYFKKDMTLFTGILVETFGYVKSKESYKNGIRHGLTRMWYPSGQLKMESNWKDGKLINRKCYDEKGNFIKCDFNKTIIAPGWSAKNLITLKKENIQEQDSTIKAYLAHRKDLIMKESKSGLRYKIYENGKKVKAESGDSASVKLRIKLLDGTFCYQTDSKELDQFLIDRNNIESGINEAVQYMHLGDSAKLIIPSHLAHGLLGDRDKIPPLSTLLVDIHLIELN